MTDSIRFIVRNDKHGTRAHLTLPQDATVETLYSVCVRAWKIPAAQRWATRPSWIEKTCLASFILEFNKLDLSDPDVKLADLEVHDGVVYLRHAT